jgi:predicted nuclease with TOPRIM domain
MIERFLQQFSAYRRLEGLSIVQQNQLSIERAEKADLQVKVNKLRLESSEKQQELEQLRSEKKAMREQLETLSPAGSAKPTPERIKLQSWREFVTAVEEPLS